MIARSITTAVCAVAIAAAALLVPPAEAREKKAYRYDNDRYVGQLTSGQELKVARTRSRSMAAFWASRGPAGGTSSGTTHMASLQAG